MDKFSGIVAGQAYGVRSVPPNKPGGPSARWYSKVFVVYSADVRKGLVHYYSFDNSQGLLLFPHTELIPVTFDQFLQIITNHKAEKI